MWATHKRQQDDVISKQSAHASQMLLQITSYRDKNGIGKTHPDSVAVAARSLTLNLKIKNLILFAVVKPRTHKSIKIFLSSKTKANEKATLQTTCLCFNNYASTVTVLPWYHDAEMDPYNSLHASAYTTSIINAFSFAFSIWTI